MVKYHIPFVYCITVTENHILG
ncbi:hypothetical protein DRF65_21915 [Chryseobacterium pennae]|uniref:Uncharacterized protein n=1 Tax=Chryseobacterium pennae TaxID=2258962 RepID=A0A3D9C3D1_9FLAO|nr:hypothetical protein DRF65_21915 [Chryseobacterium pennae]